MLMPSLTIDSTLRWNLERRKHFTRRRIVGWMDGISPGLTAQLRSYRRKRASEANRVLAVADAEKQRMINQAYQGAGAERLVGLQWARVLSGLDTIVLESGGPNGFNPLDLETLMKQLKLTKPENK